MHQVRAASQSTISAPTVEIVCGVSGVAKTVALLLKHSGITQSSPATVQLVLDLPVGLALADSPSISKKCPTIVRTWNTCPEYHADLWDTGIQTLLTGDAPDIPGAVYAAANGNSQPSPCRISAVLTASERRVLRLIAFGMSNKQIAEQLVMQLQTVLNTVSRILVKLQLTSRTAVALYYWGIAVAQPKISAQVAMLEEV